MKIEQTKNQICFQANDVIAGTYVLDDPFKPHFRSLRTPAGHETVVTSPGDHRHHKGLMYALRALDINFWEESPGSGRCGVQEILTTETEASGIRQEILWREQAGGLHTYREQRRINCRLRENGNAFIWDWQTRREALRDHRLVQSEWSFKKADGRIINYHGLGIRLPWMWCFPGDSFNGMEIAGKPVKAEEACGTNGPTMGCWGRVDGCWQPAVAAVTLKQEQDFTWYVRKEEFAYLAVGPSNAGPLDIASGSVQEERYQVIVEDREP